MDPVSFDRLVSSFAVTGSRRALARLLAVISLAGGSATLLEEGGEAGRRRHRRQARHHPGKHKQHRKGKRKGRHKRRRGCAKLGRVPKKGKSCCTGLVLDGTCQTCNVCDSGCAFTTVQAAIDDPSQLSTILVCPGTYGGNVAITRSLRIVGAGDGTGSRDTILQGIGTDSVVQIAELSGAVTLRSLRITGGSAIRGGGIRNETDPLTLTDCTITQNTAELDGGGIFTDVSSAVAMTDCTVSNNTAATGGGLYNFIGEVTTTNTVFTGNSAQFGGGLLTNGGPATLNSSQVTANTASNQGGGIFELAGGQATLNNTQVSGNTPDNCAPLGSVEGCEG